jgi:hypothetical protein
MYVDVVDKRYDNFLVYCGNTRLYLSKNQFAMLERYQRANVDMHLMVNDVVTTSLTNVPIPLIKLDDTRH